MTEPQTKLTAEQKENLLTLIVERLRHASPTMIIFGVAICALLIYGSHHIPQDKIDDIIGGAFLIMSVLAKSHGKGKANETDGQTNQSEPVAAGSPQR